MSSRCHDERQHSDALRQYIEIVRNSLLTDEFRERISDRERRQDFPFNVHNIYEVLFAVEPVLFDGWSAVAARRPLSARDARLGTSLRCLRYLHVLLVAASRTHSMTAEVLGPIAIRALGMRREPHCFCASHPSPAEAEARSSSDLVLRLAAALRQYADVRWLGQHDQGFTGHPPSRMPGGGVLYVRCFGRLPPRFGHRSLSIAVAYDLAEETGLTFDVFRGELIATPLREAVSWCSVVDGDSGLPLPDKQCELLLATTKDALRAARAVLPKDTADGNRAVADMFLGELLTAVRGLGLDDGAWITRAHARLSVPHPRQASTLTGTYLDELGEAVEKWSEHLALASD